MTYKQRTLFGQLQERHDRMEPPEGFDEPEYEGPAHWCDSCERIVDPHIETTFGEDIDGEFSEQDLLCPLCNNRTEDFESALQLNTHVKYTLANRAIRMMIGVISGESWDTTNGLSFEDAVRTVLDPITDESRILKSSADVVAKCVRDMVDWNEE